MAPAPRFSPLLQMAVQLLGSEAELCARLKWSAADLADYRSGQRNLPWTEYDRLVALIIREQASMLEKNKQLLGDLAKRETPDD